MLLDTIIQDSSKLPVFLMREEGRKIYGIYEPSECPFKWTLGYELIGDEIECPTEEFVLYNFEIIPEKIYTSVIHNNNTVRNFFYMVEEDSEILNLGKKYRKRRVMGIGSDDNPFFAYNLVEGIEPINKICLPYLNVRDNPNNEAYLNNVYDLEGNIIYQGDNTDTDDFFWGLDSVLPIYNKTFSPNIFITNNIIYIKSLSGETFSIYDPTGRMVMSRQVQTGDEVDVSTFPSGTYIATLSTGATLKFRK